MNYIKLLREEFEKEKSMPDEGKAPEDGMIISKPCMYHYAPNNVIPLIKRNGLFSEEKLVEDDPEKKEMLCKRYTPLLQNKYNLPAEKIRPDNIMHFLRMWHPHHTKCVFAFFSRIPEGIEQYKEYLGSHTPIRIVLKKLEGSDLGHKIYGVNFPTKKDWVELQDKHVESLCDKKKDWYHYFSGADKNGFFNQVPHAAIYTQSGVVPPFSLKILDDEFVR